MRQTKVYGRYVPERKDDFAWENEYAAFRMYGPALAPENPSNGVDLWLKNSPALVIDTMYGRELRDHRPYHINYDGNLDCYKVAHTAGCGGVVIKADDERLCIGGPYSRQEILEQTPDRFVFRLEYDSVPVAGQILQQSLTITAEAGTLWNKAEVVLTAKSQEPRAKSLFLGGGIFLHDTVDNYRICSKCGLIAYAEDALSDKAAAMMNFEYNGSTSQGRSYIAVRTPEATIQQFIDGTLVSLRPYTLGDTLTYYFGACWSEWCNGDEAFPTDADWFTKLGLTE
ncbi:MAG: DUF4861 family protein [Paludibacteraceae bacterium]|nr:DUF4861 family protein [Paludibacteraceae bacterium]